MLLLDVWLHVRHSRRMREAVASTAKGITVFAVS